MDILGCGSASPTLRHQPSAQVLDVRSNLHMIDCGEGTQLALVRDRLKFTRLHNIYLSHLHGDHCLGLPGLLSTMSLHQVGGAVTVHTFADGAEIIGRTVDFFCRERSYDLKFNIIDPRGGELVHEDNAITVETFPLYHRVPCVGYIFRERPRLRHINGEMARFYEIPHYLLPGIKAGDDFVTADGRVIENSRLTTDPGPSMSYAYCSDTQFDPRVARSVEGVDVLYHEATYTQADAAKAAQRGHSTAAEAARTAAEAGVKLLILGHFSKSYKNEEEHLREAREIFPNTILANEGLRLSISSKLF